MILLRMPVLAVLLLMPFTLSAQEGGGTQIDSVTGYRCLDSACVTVRPTNRCLCQKLNPSAVRLSQLRLSCTGGSACPASLRN